MIILCLGLVPTTDYNDTINTCTDYALSIGKELEV